MNDRTPIDTYKRALAAATKALSGARDIDVQFGGDAAGMVKREDGMQIILPLPALKPQHQDVSRSRGEADALALRLALHDPELYAKSSPAPGPARAVCEALEQARVEALGARNMCGVGDNLLAAENARAKKRGFDKQGLTQNDAPLEEAIGVLAREIFSNRPAPSNTSGIMHAWRDFLSDKIGHELEQMIKALDNQEAFAALAQDVLEALDMGDNSTDIEPGEDDDEAREDDQQNPNNAQEEEQDSEPGATELANAEGLEDDSDATDSIDAEDFEGDGVDGDEPPDPSTRPNPFQNSPPPYHSYTNRFD
ncbi:MAG TPA: cobaltochelatase subunit CobT, partial [Hellea balneolensis]|nr:cobaltochelatase subunit CobT [Hellea balneolensis]